jgi:hypothetical protein
MSQLQGKRAGPEGGSSEAIFGSGGNLSVRNSCEEATSAVCVFPLNHLAAPFATHEQMITNVAHTYTSAHMHTIEHTCRGLTADTYTHTRTHTHPHTYEHACRGLTAECGSCGDHDFSGHVLHLEGAWGREKRISLQAENYSLLEKRGIGTRAL